VPQVIPFLTVFSLGTMVGLMVFVMSTNARTWLGGACVGLCITSGIWALGLYNTMTQPILSSRILWHQISSIGWCLFPMAFLLFALEIARMGTPRRRYWVLLGTGIPGVVFLWLVWRSPMLFIGRFERSAWGWGMTKPGDSPALVLCVLYLALAGVVHVLLLVRWGWRTPYRQERKQACLLAGTGAFALLTGSFFDILLPIRDIPTLGTTPMFALAFFMALFHSAFRYGLLAPVPSVTASDIMRGVRDYMLVLDRDGCIVQMNVSARQALGHGVHSLQGKPWTRILPDVALPEGDHELVCDTDMLDHQGERIPVQLTASRRYNPDGDCVGYVVMAYDMRLRLALEMKGAEQMMAQARYLDEAQLIRNVLDEARLGYLLLTPDARIERGYIPACSEALGQESLAGMEYASLILPGASDEEREQVREIISRLFGQDSSWRKESLLHVLPKTCEREHCSVGLKYVLLPCQEEAAHSLNGAGSQSVYRDASARDGKEHQLLVILEDQSERVQHESALQREHDRLKMVVSVLLNREAFREFLQEMRTWRMLLLQTNPDHLADKALWMQDLYRNIHTFKGGFLRYGLRRTADHFMQYETLLSTLLGREPTGLDVRMVLSQCEPDAWMAEDLALLGDTIGTSALSPSPMVEVDRNELDRVAQEVELRIRETGISPEEYRGILYRFRELYSVHAKRLLQEYEPYVHMIAQERGLPAPVFAVQGMDVLLDGTLYNPFFRVLIHVFNNIVAHAIETPEERVSAAKPAQARIECHVESRQGNLLLEIADDGRGIDPERIRQEWNRRRRDVQPDQPEDDRTMIQHIFEPGYSTALAPDSLSGRGIGLFAVAHAVRALGGTVRVQSRKGAFTRFLFNIPMKPNQDGGGRL
jgi:two-component system, chemotaxis family, sensor kinase CheA